MHHPSVFLKTTLMMPPKSWRKKFHLYCHVFLFHFLYQIDAHNRYQQFTKKRTWSCKKICCTFYNFDKSRTSWRVDSSEIDAKSVTGSWTTFLKTPLDGCFWRKKQRSSSVFSEYKMGILARNGLSTQFAPWMKTIKLDCRVTTEAHLGPYKSSICV